MPECRSYFSFFYYDSLLHPYESLSKSSTFTHGQISLREADLSSSFLFLKCSGCFVSPYFYSIFKVQRLLSACQKTSRLFMLFGRPIYFLLNLKTLRHDVVKFSGSINFICLLLYLSIQYFHFGVCGLVYTLPDHIGHILHLHDTVLSFLSSGLPLP